MDTGLRLLISSDEIAAIVKRLSAEIDRDYAGKDPVIIGILKGAAVFTVDLVQAIKIPSELDFMQTTSYGTKDKPDDGALVTCDISVDISGRDVIVAEGIVDRGVTVKKIISHLKKKGPASISVASLLVRGDEDHGVEIRYAGAHIGAGFVVGYGMDFKGRLRALPAVYIVV